MHEHPSISWAYPKPRTGFLGVIDRLSGPGATPAELWLQCGFAVSAGVAAGFFGAYRGFGWTWWQIAIAAYIAFDICGGIATNATSSAKRWWHRPERRTFGHFMRFMAAHIYFPLLVVLAFRPGDWTFFAIVYGAMLLAGLLLTQTPQYLSRPVAFLLYVGAILLHLYAFTPIPGLEWFIPLLFLKLIMSHFPREEPYRPSWEASHTP